MNHWATPQNIVKAKAAEAAKEDSQQELGFKEMIGPFTLEQKTYWYLLLASCTYR